MSNTIGGFIVFVLVAIIVVSLFWVVPIYGRYQKRENATNEVRINEIKIKQFEQLTEVEKQKAEIKIIEAKGIAEAQRIINATLTDKYLQHEAIKAQEKMAESPNHTTIYIPSGQNGIPIVKTLE